MATELLGFICQRFPSWLTVTPSLQRAFGNIWRYFSVVRIVGEEVLCGFQWAEDL